MPRITPLLALSAILVPSIAIASSVEFEIDGSASSATTIFDFQLPLAGTLIGDYDAKANPIEKGGKGPHGNFFKVRQLAGRQKRKSAF